MKSKRPSLLKITELNHFSKNGELINQYRDLPNLVHDEGEEFMLRAIFEGGRVENSFIPNIYFFGLDNRSAITSEDTMETIALDASEPSVNGYSRQGVGSTSNFQIELVGGIWEADSPIITFFASGGSWGPISNLFLTTSSDNSGFLISTVELSDTFTLTDGQLINMKMIISLKDFTG